MKEIQNYNKNIFENIKHIDEYGNEYWYARELQKALQYKEWRKFKRIIDKAVTSCSRSNNDVLDHFVQLDKMVDIGSNTRRKIKDYKLSRYACYLIAQNGDSHMKVISLAQTYFAYQTRKQEILEEEFKDLSEDEKRIRIRNEVRKGNYGLNKAAKDSGVKNFDKFHNAGYKGLYNGESADDIAKRKKLRYREDILDNMGSIELADNLFRIVQTEDKLKRDNVDNEYTANSVHYEVGKKVRQTIKELGGTMPEDLPTPNRSINEIQKNNNKLK
ncbi:MAG: DNA damage-inducible protein D [Bacilli bacterium]|nr:DNA damage-inducible protein D [Bacilli bacterium]